jgi:hypothetical protein
MSAKSSALGVMMGNNTFAEMGEHDADIAKWAELTKGRVYDLIADRKFVAISDASGLVNPTVINNKDFLTEEVQHWHKAFHAGKKSWDGSTEKLIKNVNSRRALLILWEQADRQAHTIAIRSKKAPKKSADEKAVAKKARSDKAQQKKVAKSGKAKVLRAMKRVNYSEDVLDAIKFTNKMKRRTEARIERERVLCRCLAKSMDKRDDTELLKLLVEQHKLAKARVEAKKEKQARLLAKSRAEAKKE